MRIAHFSTDGIPLRERKAFMQETYGAVAKIDITPLDDTPLSGAATMLGLPGLTLARTQIGPCIAGRTKDRVGDEDDDLVLCLALRGDMTWQWRDDRQVEAGQAYIGANDIAGFRAFSKPARILDIVIPRKLLQPVVPGAALSPRLFQAAPEIQLLSHYIDALFREAGRLSPEAETLAATHVHDLVTLALGSSTDTMDIARGRGLRAAKLQAVKDDIDAHLLDPRLSVSWIMGRHSISSRYLRALFQDDETTFSDFVTSRRLLLAWKRLRNPRYDQQLISTIAFDCGFNDLSWFNRAFRRQFLMTPSEARSPAYFQSPKQEW